MRGLEAAEHLVERLPQPADLVVGLWQGQPLLGLGGRDGRRPPAHRLDRPERRPETA